MSPETIAEKGERLFEAGAVTITHQDAESLVAQITGDSGNRYRAVLDQEGAWCSCPATTDCSHLIALELAAEQPDRHEGEDDPFAGLAPGEPLQRGEPDEVEILPAGDEPTTTLAVPNHDAALADLATVPFSWRTLHAIAGTELVPKDLRGRPAAILATILFGRDLGLGPAESLVNINVVEGRPAPAAELMLRLYRAAGHRLTVVKADDQEVVVEGTRGDNADTLEVSYSLADAERAGLVSIDPDGKPRARSKRGAVLPWEAHPADLLWARAVTRLVRRLAPDAIASPTVEPIE